MFRQTQDQIKSVQKSEISEFLSLVPSKLYLIFMSRRLIVCCSTQTCHYNIYVGTRYDMIVLLGRPGSQTQWRGIFIVTLYCILYCYIIVVRRTDRPNLSRRFFFCTGHVRARPMTINLSLRLLLLLLLVNALLLFEKHSGLNEMRL